MTFRQLRAQHLRIGRRGEAYAELFLRRHGMTILARDFKIPRQSCGELDIVALDGDTLCFVEVKTLRKFHHLYTPEAHLLPAQKKRIRRSALWYLEKCHHPNIKVRFDLIEVIAPGIFSCQDLRYHAGYLQEHDHSI